MVSSIARIALESIPVKSMVSSNSNFPDTRISRSAGGVIFKGAQPADDKIGMITGQICFILICPSYSQFVPDQTEKVSEVEVIDQISEATQQNKAALVKP